MTALSRPPIRFTAVAVVYLLASRLGTAFVVQPENLAVFWPAAGLLLGYLLVSERRRWPAAAVAAAVGNLVANLTFGHTLPVSAGFAAINALEPLAIAWLIEGVRGGTFRLDRVHDVFLLFAAPLGGCAVSALAGAGLVTAGLGAPSYWGVWRVWWLADALGAILLAPLVLAFGLAAGRRTWLANLELGAVVAALVGLTGAIFATDLGRRYALLAMPYPVFPVLLWAALRLDLRGTVTAVVAVALVATSGTLRGHGPFGTMDASPATEVLVTQGFAATVCLSSLVLAVAMRERRAAEGRLRGERQVLRTVLDSMGDAVLVADAGGRVLLTNAAFDRLHADVSEAAGRPPDEWSWAFGVYLPDGATPCPPDRLPIFRAARGEACDDERLVVVNGAHPDGLHVSVTGRPVVGPAGVEGGLIAIRDVTPALRAEAAVRESEQRFRATFHSQFQFIGLMAPDGTLLEANRTALAAAGVREADVVGRPFWETAWWAHDPAQQERLKAAVRRAAGGDRDRFEASHPTADGGLMWVDFSLTPFRDPTGAVVLLIPEGRDITERKRMEAALRESEERFRVFADHSADGLFIQAPGGRIVDVNRQACESLGYTRDELIGLTPRDIDPDLTAEAAAAITARRAAGEAVAFDSRHRRKDGTTFPVEVRIRPFATAGGPLALAAVRDITARKEAEERLRLSEERFRTLAGDAPVGIFETDADGGCIFANARWCAMAGLTVEQAGGRGWVTALHPDDRTRVFREWSAATAARAEFASEYRFRTPGGAVTWLSGSAIALRDVGGAVVGYIGTVTDITARKAAEAAVREGEERYRVLFEHSSDAHLIFDDTGIIDCNNAAVAMLRCADKRQVLALHPAELSPEFQPDGRRSLEKCVDMDAAARRHGYHRFDWVHRRFDGDVFPCEVTLTPVELHGRPALLVVWHDLTERQRAERALRGSEERFRAAMEGSLDAVYFLAAERGPGGAVLDFRFTELNGRGAALVSRTREDVLGRRLCELLPVNRTGGFFDKYVRVAETGEPLEEEFAIPPADGLTAAWLRHQVVRVGDGVAITTQDITARRAAEERVRASLREKEVLLKEIHHRVKNNLQIVSALLDLQSDYTADPGALEMFRESRGRVKSMALVHERLYRSEDVARVNFAEYVRQLADDLYHAYRVSDDVRLELAVDVSPLPIDVAIPCGLLLNELMANCFKHAFQGAPGVLRVSLTGRAGANVLVVADDGVGFPAGIDFRNTASFGLQLVHTLVEQLGGSIELSADRGTAFTVRFANGR